MNMLKKTLSVISVVLLAIGVLGFFSDPLVGIFAVDPLHNIVHLLTGVLGLLAITLDWDRMFARVFGFVYAVITLLGFFTGGVLDSIMVNTADNVLHLAIALALLYLGFIEAQEK